MNLVKYSLVVIFFSAIFSNNTAKVILKDGSEIIGIVYENYSTTHVKINTYDGSWSTYSKNNIEKIEYGNFRIKKSTKDTWRKKDFITSDGAEYNKFVLSLGANIGPGSGQAFKYAFYQQKYPKKYVGFSISGIAQAQNPMQDPVGTITGYEDRFSEGSRNITYLMGYSYLKYKNETYTGFYHSIDAGIVLNTIIYDEGSLPNLFGISILGILSIFNNPDEFDLVIEDVRRDRFGIGINGSVGYALKKIMLDFSFSHHLIPKKKFLGFSDAKSQDLFTIKLSYKF